MTWHEEVYQRGWRAHVNGEPLESCPFVSERARNHWEAGWNSAAAYMRQLDIVKGWMTDDL